MEPKLAPRQETDIDPGDILIESKSLNGVLIERAVVALKVVSYTKLLVHDPVLNTNETLDLTIYTDSKLPTLVNPELSFWKLNWKTDPAKGLKEALKYRVENYHSYPEGYEEDQPNSVTFKENKSLMLITGSNGNKIFVVKLGDYSNGAIEILYKDGSQKILSITDLTLSGYKFEFPRTDRLRKFLGFDGLEEAASYLGLILPTTKKHKKILEKPTLRLSNKKPTKRLKPKEIKEKVIPKFDKVIIDLFGEKFLELKDSAIRKSLGRDVAFGIHAQGLLSRIEQLKKATPSDEATLLHSLINPTEGLTIIEREAILRDLNGLTPIQELVVRIGLTRSIAVEEKALSFKDPQAIFHLKGVSFIKAALLRGFEGDLFSFAQQHKIHRIVIKNFVSRDPGKSIFNYLPIRVGVGNIRLPHLLVMAESLRENPTDPVNFHKVLEKFGVHTSQVQSWIKHHTDLMEILEARGIFPSLYLKKELPEAINNWVTNFPEARERLNLLNWRRD